MSDNEEGQDVTGWLDEEDEEVEQPKKAPPIQEDLKQEIDMMLKPAYIIKNSDLFYAMCELEDLEFESMPDEQQEIYMRSLIVETYQPGECIIREGDVGNDLYFVVATQDTNRVAEVEVIQNQDSGQEQFLTKLRRGQYFGQKFFLTRKMVSQMISHLSRIRLFYILLQVSMNNLFTFLLACFLLIEQARRHRTCTKGLTHRC